MSAMIWCPFPDRASAREVANQLLDERLIACANLLGPIESIFEWHDERNTCEEIGVIFKTDTTRLAAAIQCLERLHPYDTPAIMGWHCDIAPAATQSWLGRLSQGKQ